MELHHQQRVLEDSGQFNASWFRWRYGDLLAEIGFDETQSITDFFLEQAATLDLDPCRHFDTSLYLATHPAAQRSPLNPLVHALLQYPAADHADRLAHVRCHKDDWQHEIREAAWQIRIGQRSDGEARLRAVLAQPGLPSSLQALAALALATALDLSGATQAALTLLLDTCPDALDTEGSDAFPGRYLPLMGQLALKLGQRDLAKRCFDRQSKNGDLLGHLGLACCADQQAETLGHLNLVFESAGLQSLSSQSAEQLTLDTLCAAGPGAEPPFEQPDNQADAPLVSIIMPAFNAARTITTAVRSLLAQSYHNIEIIVVDDASTDSTRQALQPLLADPRLQLIPLAENQGAYAARNAGLEAASGAYVTTHDADDWSHPDKLALQIAEIGANGCRASMSAWLRVEDSLNGMRHWLSTGRYVVKNHSSFLAKRKDVAALGGWLPLRIAADSDLIERFLARYGAESLAIVLPDIPLSFARADVTSLTNTKSTHAATKAAGLRRNIAEISWFWIAMGVTDQSGEGARLRWTALEDLFNPSPADLLIFADLSDPEEVEAIADALLTRPETRDVAIFPVTRPHKLQGGPEAIRRFCQAAGFLISNPRVRLCSTSDFAPPHNGAFQVKNETISPVSLEESRMIARQSLGSEWTCI